MTKENSAGTSNDFVTFEIGEQLFGVPIDDVQDVFKPQRLTPVPLSHPDGESYGLLIDKIGDVLTPEASSFEANPVNLDPRWRAVSKGVFRLEKRLLIVLNISTILDFGRREAA
jgi:purine-binding chemotaxis protein CheW